MYDECVDFSRKGIIYYLVIRRLGYGFMIMYHGLLLLLWFSVMRLVQVLIMLSNLFLCNNLYYDKVISHMRNNFLKSMYFIFIYAYNNIEMILKRER